MILRGKYKEKKSMKCYNCGCESPEDFAFCPKCGAPRSSEPQWGGDVMQPSQPPQAVQRVLTSLKDSLFLVFCILFTVGTAAPIINGGFSVINILLTIFLWITYAKAQSGVASRENLRCISGTVFASYVIGYVAAGGLALGGLAMMALGKSASAILAEIMAYTGVDLYDVISGGFASFFASFLGIVCIIVAVVLALFNYFGIRSIHRFVQSVYRGLDDAGIQPVKVNAAGAWLLVLGIFYGIDTVSSLFNGNMVSFVIAGSLSAAYIIGYVMVKRYYN